MSIRKTRFALSVSAGLLIAPLLWMINTQLGEILPYLDCQYQARLSATTSFAAAAAASLSAAISWRSGSYARPIAATLSFFGSMSTLAAAIFAFALLMQGVASLVLSGCER
jgi:hypothetical protein